MRISSITNEVEVKLFSSLSKLISGVEFGAWQAITMPDTINNNSYTNPSATAVKQININEVSRHIGEKVSVCSMVYGSKAFSNMTLFKFRS